VNETERLQSVERAWLAVWDQLKAGNPDFFVVGTNGMESALIEIRRLQEAAK
jgi:hypothetical protein